MAMGSILNPPQQLMSKRREKAVVEAVAIIAALPDEVIVQYMDDMDDDIWSTSEQVARFFHGVLMPPYGPYGPGDDDLYEISNVLAWLHEKGISRPAELLVNEFNFQL